ncbi:hypothetical protein DFH08DRAFT_804029 [Mycena albidolilacea]|uniref:Uncharacterized protein n=1 Tax=Mycena albidolilacea TaxID=1033008 RepID=A0AAD7AB63_9AGAR|nr:hypothetical protein DFH08DRAFT_804029 [Mycena albidolilacea]
MARSSKKNETKRNVVDMYYNHHDKSLWVYTSLPEEEPSKVTPVRVTDDDLEPDPPAHRGRAREHAMQRENIERLLNVASNNCKEFWSLVRGWTDPKHRTAQVSAEQLQEVFETRLNPPEIVAEEFDRDERDRHH